MKKLFTLFALMLLAGITSLKAQEFQKVTSASELSSGDVIIIGCSSANCYAGLMGTNTFLTSVESQADALRITLGGGSYGRTLTTSEGTIGATAVKKLSSTSGTTTWNISFEDGDAYITSSDVACGSIQYNPSAPRFTCYTSTQSPVQIYKSKSVTPPDDTSEFEFEYNSDGTATVTGGPKSGDIVIPSSVSHEGKTYSVTSIGEWAFYGCTGLTSVTIPNSVTSIGDCAFEDCTGLTSVTIGNSVTEIACRAFYGCTGLTSVTIPNSVTSIGAMAFYGCSGLTSVTIPNSVTSIGECVFTACSGLASINVQTGNTKYDSREKCNAIIETASNTLIAGCKNTVIPSGVTSIGAGAFEGCSGLTSVTIPNSVTSIENYAFYECTGLTSVTIPNSVTSIGECVFIACSGLASINVQTGNTKYDSREKCNAIIETASNTLIAGCKNTVIPSGVTSIGDFAFFGCSGLTSVTIPNSVTSIGDCAFEGCSGLTSISIPNSVTSIGIYAFYECNGLTSVTIPNRVTSIGFSAFYGCSGLTSVTIPNSVTSIGSSAFEGCSGLTSVTIPNSVTSIGSSAFEGCI